MEQQPHPMWAPWPGYCHDVLGIELHALEANAADAAHHGVVVSISSDTTGGQARRAATQPDFPQGYDPRSFYIWISGLFRLWPIGDVMEQQQPRPMSWEPWPGYCHDVQAIVEFILAQRATQTVTTSSPVSHGESAAAGDHGVVVVNINGDDTTTSQEKSADDHHHVIDVAAAPEEDDDDADDLDNNRCVVCTEPSDWVAIGRCGHRLVCPKCTVRTRFFHRNKRCCVCRARCPKVIVAKRDAKDDILSTLPLFAFREGRVGKQLWYHRHTAAYYEDEQVYDEARAAWQGVLSPFYKPLVVLVLWFGSCLFWGYVMGFAYAGETKRRSAQVRAYAVSMPVAMSIAMTCWSAVKCCLQDPLQKEEMHRAKKQYIAQS